MARRAHGTELVAPVTLPNVCLTTSSVALGVFRRMLVWCGPGWAGAGASSAAPGQPGSGLTDSVSSWGGAARRFDPGPPAGDSGVGGSGVNSLQPPSRGLH